MKSRYAWLVFGSGLVVLSSAAVAVRALGPYPEGVPPTLVAALHLFVDPGTIAWWLTMGGLFQAFPTTFTGYSVVVLANTIFWLVVAAIVVFVVKRIRRLG